MVFKSSRIDLRNITGNNCVLCKGYCLEINSFCIFFYKVYYISTVLLVCAKLVLKIVMCFHL
jgi:hypothetical protein